MDLMNQAGELTRESVWACFCVSMCGGVVLLKVGMRLLNRAGELTWRVCGCGCFVTVLAVRSEDSGPHEPGR